LAVVQLQRAFDRPPNLY